MAWIRQIGEDAASGPLSEVYAKVANARGRASNLYRAQSLRPAPLAAHVGLHDALAHGESELTAEERLLVGALCAAANRCGYSLMHHREALLALWQDAETVDEVLRDFRAVADLPARWRALLEFADKLSRAPHLMGAEDVAALKAAGLTDAGALDVVHIVAYQSFVDRLALGLGVDVSAGEAAGSRYDPASQQKMNIHPCEKG
jgi:uncharacterized peroxidase-related enzyme